MVHELDAELHSTLQRGEMEWPEAYLVEAALSEGARAALRKVKHLVVRLRCHPHLVFPLHLQRERSSN
jgi:hypothetical protein